MRELTSYLNRIPDLVGAGKAEMDSGDQLEATYFRQKYEI